MLCYVMLKFGGDESENWIWKEDLYSLKQWDCTAFVQMQCKVGLCDRWKLV